MECLRQTRDPATIPDVAMRCTAQAASMMRQSQGALRLLLRAQDAKARTEADDTAANAAAWAEHCAEQWMMEALAADLVPVAHPAPARAESEYPGQSPTEQHHETDSIPATVSDQPRGTASPEAERGHAADQGGILVMATEPSQEATHSLTDQYLETDSIAVTVIGQGGPEDRDHQTEPARIAVTEQELSRNMGRIPVLRVHETVSGNPGPSLPLRSPDPAIPLPGRRPWFPPTAPTIRTGQTRQQT